jgi:hypothetical protein
MVYTESELYLEGFKVTSANVDQQLFADLALKNLTQHDLIPQPREGLL